MPGIFRGADSSREIIPERHAGRQANYSSSSVSTFVAVALVSVTLPGSIAATRPPTRTDLPFTMAEGRVGLKKIACSLGDAGFGDATGAPAAGGSFAAGAGVEITGSTLATTGADGGTAGAGGGAGTAARAEGRASAGRDDRQTTNAA